MQTAVELPENVLSLTSSARAWSSVTVIRAEFQCAGRVMYEVPHQQEARLGLILDEVGTHRSEPRLTRDGACPVDYKPAQLNFVPAGMAIWGYSSDIRYARDVRLCFDVQKLAERCHLDAMSGRVNAPKLRFSDEQAAVLMRLLADAVDDPDPSTELYGDALVTALAARLFGREGTASKRPAKLSPMQLRDAMSFLEDRLPRRVELATLSSLAGLSPSYYNRAFKASTGLAPYQWQLHARIQRAKNLLLESARSLDDIADATGFADAVHFGRTFRKLTGATPSAWRRDRMA